MRYCPMCGAPLPPDSRNCAACQAPLSAVRTPDRSQPVVYDYPVAGLLLAWRCLTGGFRLLMRRPVLLLLPVIAVVLSAGVSVYARGNFGQGLMPGVMPLGLLSQNIPGWLLLYLTQAGTRFGQVVPVFSLGSLISRWLFPPVLAGGGMTALSWVILLSSSWFLSFLCWLINVVQLRWMVRGALAEEGRVAAGSSPWFRLLWPLLALPTLIPVSLIFWLLPRQVIIALYPSMQLLLGAVNAILQIGLITWICALLVSDDEMASPGELWRHMLLRSEGLAYLANALVLLTVGIFVLQYLVGVLLSGSMRQLVFSVGGGYQFIVFLLPIAVLTFLTTGIMQGWILLMRERHHRLMEDRVAVEA